MTGVIITQKFKGQWIQGIFRFQGLIQVQMLNSLKLIKFDVILYEIHKNWYKMKKESLNYEYNWCFDFQAEPSNFRCQYMFEPPEQSWPLKSSSTADFILILSFSCFSFVFSFYKKQSHQKTNWNMQKKFF